MGPLNRANAQIGGPVPLLPLFSGLKIPNGELYWENLVKVTDELEENWGKV